MEHTGENVEKCGSKNQTGKVAAAAMRLTSNVIVENMAVKP